MENLTVAESSTGLSGKAFEIWQAERQPRVDLVLPSSLLPLPPTPLADALLAAHPELNAHYSRFEVEARIRTLAARLLHVGRMDAK